MRSLWALLPLGAMAVYACFPPSAGSPSPTAAGAVVVGGAQGAADAAVPRPDDDDVATSFVFVGGCRMALADWDAQADPSSANVPQLDQTLSDIASLPLTPRFFFFTGDLVTALVPGTATLQRQLEGWADFYAGHPSGVASLSTLVPIVGNHESLQKVGVNELPNPAADGVWARWIASRGFDAFAGNGPDGAPPNPDALQNDQSTLSYSFDDGCVHYVVVNTDTSTTTPEADGGTTKIGWVPLDWLSADLDAAEANPAISHVFVLGHKPIVAPTGKTEPEWAVHPDLAGRFAALLDRHGKVDAYLCSHTHEWDVRPLPGDRGVPQVVAGNGGSPLEATWKEPHPYFGFSEARLYRSGRVGVTSYARPAPKPYYAAPAVAATARPEITLVPPR